MAGFWFCVGSGQDCEVRNGGWGRGMTRFDPLLCERTAHTFYSRAAL